MSTITEVATLVASACSLTVGTNLFMGRLPDEISACGAVFEYAGKIGENAFGATNPVIEHPRVQVVFRGEAFDYATPRGLAETAYRALAAVKGQALSGTSYLAIDPIQPPFSMGADKNDRPLIAFNCQVSKELSA